MVRSKAARIGITGGIGSGKTTVCRIFETLGIPVYYADARAKSLMNEDEQLRGEIVDLFGEQAYSKEGVLDRQYLASIVFQDKSKLKALEGLVHPAVARDGKKWHEAQQGGVPYTLKEAALLVENGSYKYFDKIIVVTAPEEIRIERVQARDKVEAKAVRARMKAQLSQEEKVKVADFIIENDGKKSLIKQVLEVHRALLV